MIENTHRFTRTVSANPQGTNFVRLARALIESKGHLSAAQRIAEEWKDSPAVGLTLKAIVDPTSSVNTPLEAYGISSEVHALLREISIFDRLKSQARRSLFRTDIPFELSATAGGGWVALDGSSGLPVSSLTFGDTLLEPYNFGTVVALSRELVRRGGRDAEGVIRRILIDAIGTLTDTQFLDPSITAVTDLEPGAITAGATEVTSTGSSASQITTDLDAMLDALTSWRAPTWIMRTETAVTLASTANAAGSRAFEDVEINRGDGDRLFGLPVMSADHLPSVIVLLDAASFFFAEGPLSVDAGEEASIEMTTLPASGSGGSPSEHTELVSFWQRRLHGVRVLRTVAWARASDTDVIYMTVAY